MLSGLYKPSSVKKCAGDTEITCSAGCAGREDLQHGRGQM